MDLVMLVTACALTVGPKIMHALIWHHSGGEPWSFTVPRECQPQVYRTVGDAVRAAHATYPDDDTIRVRLTGLSANPQSVSAVMFAPCQNITVAAGQRSQLTERCGTSPRIKGDPIYCAILAYRASWERLDNAFADAIRTSVANIAPKFEMTDVAGSMPQMSGLQFSLTTPKRHRRSHRTIASGAGRAPSSGPSPAADRRTRRTLRDLSARRGRPDLLRDGGLSRLVGVARQRLCGRSSDIGCEQRCTGLRDTGQHRYRPPLASSPHRSLRSKTPPHRRPAHWMIASAAGRALSFRQSLGRPTVRRSTIQQQTDLQPIRKSLTLRAHV